MAKMRLELANGLAGEDGEWIKLPDPSDNVHVKLTAADTPDFTAIIEGKDISGEVDSLHAEAFATAKSELINLGSLPYTHLRVRQDPYTAGTLSSGANISH